MPKRFYRQRNERGELVCDECKNRAPVVGSVEVGETYTAAFSLCPRCGGKGECWIGRKGKRPVWDDCPVCRGSGMGTPVSYDTDRPYGDIPRGGSMSQRVAHDSGDNALLHHCPFCGSGAVTGRSDGSAECDYCHSVFTVQVQPMHPNMPQTVDGKPQPAPGMPAGRDTELSTPVDPAVDEERGSIPADSSPPPPGDPAEEEPVETPVEDEPKGEVPPQFRNSSRRVTASDKYDAMDETELALEIERRFDEFVFLFTDREMQQARERLRADDRMEGWSPADLDRDHLVVSTGGWFCEVCGAGVNGTTNDLGHPLIQGDSVRHTDSADLSRVKRQSSQRTYSRFFTDEGEVLDTEQYISHLALLHSGPKREAVLSRIRQHNQNR